MVTGLERGKEPILIVLVGHAKVSRFHLKMQ